jgi:hypothetical protein
MKAKEMEMTNRNPQKQVSSFFFCLNVGQRQIKASDVHKTKFIKEKNLTKFTIEK